MSLRDRKLFHSPLFLPAVNRHGSVVRLVLLAGCLLLLLPALAACGRGGNADADAQPTIRAAKPTFTPTPGQAQQAPAAAQQPVAVTPTPAAPAQLLPTGAVAIINTPLVNVRSGPGLDFEVVTIVERGQEFDILAKDSLGEWWQVCCVEEETVWVIGQLVDTDGPVDQVPVFGSQSQAAAAVQAPSVQATGQEDIQFDLAGQEQFAESELVRIFMYVHDDSSSLPDYSLRVVYNGTDLPVNELSFGGQPGFTWPFQDARQRSQNWKSEFRNIGPAGTWTVQLLDANGVLVGPAAEFVLDEGETEQELYVEYERQ